MAEYTLIDQPSEGIELYQQLVSGGEPDYILKIDLRYASLYSSFGTEKGGTYTDKWGRTDQDVASYGGNNPRYISQSLEEFKLPSGNTPVAISSAALGGRWPDDCSYCSGNITFPIRTEGTLVTEGYGAPDGNNPDSAGGTNTNNYRVLCFNNDTGQAHIYDYYNIKKNSLCDNEIVSVTKDVVLGATSGGRTFIGVSNSNNDEFNEILIFSSKLATSTYANDQLKEAPFFATETMQLDGGGSSQLWVNGTTRVSSTRPLWNALVIGKKSNPTSTLTYEEKCNFVFDELESIYPQYFSNGSNTISTDSGYYRYYRVKGNYNFLYAYNQNLWYYISGNWFGGDDSIDDWYEYLIQYHE